MEYLEKMRGFLQGFPLWQGELLTDTAGPETGSVGLFPLGVTVISRQEDVLGRVKTRYKAEFALRRVAAGNEEEAGWLLELQSWVMGQKNPGFGDEPDTETIRAEKGKLVSRSQSAATFEVRLTVEFTKIM